MSDDDLTVRLERIEARVATLESSLAAIERIQKVVLTEVRGLATKVDRLTAVADPARRRI